MKKAGINAGLLSSAICRFPTSCSTLLEATPGAVSLFAYRSYLYGIDLSVAKAVEDATHNAEAADISVFITGDVHRDLAGTEWPARLKLADIHPHNPRVANFAFYHLETSY